MAEAGDREVMKAFEEVTTRNVRAAVDHGNTTRKLVKELSDRVNVLEAENVQLKQQISNFNLTMANIQARLYKGGL